MSAEGKPVFLRKSCQHQCVLTISVHCKEFWGGGVAVLGSDGCVSSAWLTFISPSASCVFLKQKKCSVCQCSGCSEGRWKMLSSTCLKTPPGEQC